MRITLVIYSLDAGGAERVMSTMANYWAEKGWTVSLLTLASDGPPPFYKLHPAVRHESLAIGGLSNGLISGVVSNVKRARLLRRAILATRPDVVISTMSQTNVLTLVATKEMKVPVIVREANNPYQNPIGLKWSLLRRWAYPRAACLVLLNAASLRFFPGAVRKRARVIPNPVAMTAQPRLPDSKNGRHKTIVAMGRLVPQKGFDILLRAFARIAEKHPDWSLEILGEGLLREELESLVRTLGLAGRVRLPGVTKEPFEKLRQADIFVMSSHYEGFPNSLNEAMACGLPAISFDCQTGPAEIIRDGIDGVLVPPEDGAALGEAMDQLMSDGRRREALAARAPEVLERFSLQKVMGLWDALVAEVTAGGQPRQE